MAAPETPEQLGVRPVRRAFEQVADQLRELIVDGTLWVGQRLPTEAELSAQFGVSRATVREALRLLSAEDLVRTAKGSGGGSFVTLPTLAGISERVSSNLGVLTLGAELDLEQFLEARELLEVPAARLAARRRSQDDVEALWGSVPDEPLSLASEQQFTHNRDFHFRLVEASGNPLLSIASEPVFSVLQTHLRRTDQSASDQRSINECHRRIATAIEDGNEDGAAEASHRHLELLRPGYERAWMALAEMRADG
jgi:DNA-binding FadR family transcriptional regulator